MLDRSIKIVVRMPRVSRCAKKQYKCIQSIDGIQTAQGLHQASSSPPPAEEENRTIFRGVNPPELESTEVAVLEVTMDDAEFFRIGCNRRDILDCNRDANVVGRRELLRFERGVEGPPVDVNVDKDVRESEGVKGAASDGCDIDSSAVFGLFSAGRCVRGCGISWITVGGAESRLRWEGRGEFAGGVSSNRARGLYAFDGTRWGVRDMCRPMAIC